MKNFVIEIAVECESKENAESYMNLICDNIEGVVRYIVADVKEIPVISIDKLKSKMEADS